MLSGSSDAESSGRRSPVFVAAVGPAVRCGSGSRQRCAGTVAHTGHIPEDWPEMLCSQLTEGFSLLRLLLPSLRDKQQLCFCCPLSPPFTRTVAAAATEGRQGAADCDQQVSLSPSVSMSLLQV